MNVTSTPKIFRWDDPGAPQTSQTAGSTNAIIKACLVGTGGIAYGSKPSAGWSVAFEDAGAHQLVVRNDPVLGNGAFMKFDDSNTQYTGLMGFESMSDINTGVAPTRATNVWGYKASTASHPWILIADERTFYFNVFPFGNLATQFLSSQGHYILGGGDFTRFDDKPGVFVTGKFAQHSTNNDNFGGSGNVSSFSLNCTRRPVGSIVPTPSMFTSLNQSSWMGFGSTQASRNFPAAGGSCWAKFPIYASTSEIFGYMRGVWCPMSIVLYDQDSEYMSRIKPSLQMGFEELVTIGGQEASSTHAQYVLGLETKRSWDLY